MNRTVKLYRRVKRPPGAWGTQPATSHDFL
jgi:hypothetical protein